MLNTHTATRTFRELQYDVRVFLETLCSLVKCANDNNSTLVEARWSDGSIDVIPTVGLVKETVGNTFPYLQVADAFLRAARNDSMQGASVPKDATLLKITVPQGLSSKLKTIGGPNVNQVLENCTIDMLVAKSIRLDAGTEINGLDVLGEFTAQQTNPTKVVAGSINAVSVYTDTSDLSQILLDRPITNFGASVISSDLLGYASYSKLGNHFYSRLYIDDIMYVESTTGLTIQLDAPVVDTNPAGRYRTIENVTISSNGRTTFSKDSSFGSLLLYPRLFVYTTESTSDGNTYVYRMGEPIADDNNKIVTVYNRSNKVISACNVWSCDVGNNVRVPKVKAVNYVDLPPYTQVDFLFSFADNVSSGIRTIYMHPMKRLETVK